MKKKIVKINVNSKIITFSFSEENHTLGNLLRFLIQGNPMVDFVGYNVPHPSESIMNLKISSKFSCDQINILILAIKNCGEIGILLGNFFNKKKEDRKRVLKNPF